MTDTIDERLIESVDNLEQYLSDQEAASHKLKKGFMILTKAKQRLPEHALTEISYHEEFTASRVVVLDSDGFWQLQDASKGSLQKVKDNAVRNRRASKNVTNAESSQARLHLDPLMWFSSLPPSDLRQAQKQFISGLHALLVAAASAHEVQKAINGLASAP
ncbi:uncharacterized protein PHALS_13379 [Plasmopara halstedii]|uniref:Vacuolar ATPase assembly protein VMA22 n=1 Tax=Plasmopara halstedii TaxID=4781 RepID=A0A0P1AQN0_PLAHL|nr:uncharacterized protein PHALS_13379 [Plasmopara halstedii]CEG43165.1 hypothetical protein PHALS_13379 [Plasmopara halstedii]|eukprot:XP_024579534.1 hypothetical protein PHALS_13379 [Plasmopara halstedii]